MSTTAKWTTVPLVKVPDGVGEAAKQVQQMLETVSTLLELLSAVLDVIKVYIVDVTSPLAVLAKTLKELIDQILKDLDQTGLYMYVDGPQTPGQSVDLPHFGANLAGGLPAWRQRMAYAFLSPGAANRPQFSNTASVVSLHLLVTSGSFVTLYNKLGFLLAVFGQRASPNMEPPRNVKARIINKEFYDRYYDKTTGLISDVKVTAYGNGVLTGSQPLESVVLLGNSAKVIDEATAKFVLRYDLLTGEELIIDQTSGAVLSVGGHPDAVLITWKADQNLIPTKYRIERTDVKGGTLQVRETKDSAGRIVTSNELVRDDAGQPVRTWTQVKTVEFEYGYGKSLFGGAHEQFAYLDTTVEAGRVYYYRVVPIYGEKLQVSFPVVNPYNPALQVLLALINTITTATSGVGDPSEVVSAYVPNTGDDKTIQALSWAAAEAHGKWWTHSPMIQNGSGWLSVSIGDLMKPLILLADQIKNFVDLILASIAAGTEELIKFIELLQTKINTINTLIEVLQTIIAFLDVLEAVVFSALYVSTDNGNQGVLKAVNDTSLAGAPAAGAQDYVASITLLGGTSSAAIRALQLVFGL